jgi:hypothetical protein
MPYFLSVDKSSSQQVLSISDINVSGSTEDPVGSKIVTITVDVKIADIYSAGETKNQATLNDIPAIFGPEIKSDSNDSTTVKEPTTLDIENVPPVATDNNVSTNKNTNISGNVITDDNGDGQDYDSNGDDFNVTSFTINGTTYTVPADGNETAEITEGNITISSDGNYTFVPATGYDGNVSKITYTVSDGTNQSNGDLNIKVTNNTPTAQDDNVTVDEDTVLHGDVIAGTSDGTVDGNATDSDADGDSLSVTAAEYDSDGDGTRCQSYNRKFNYY